METKEVKLTRIKKTKSVEMYYDEEEGLIFLTMISKDGGLEQVQIPISKAFQVKRGLESAVQRFYRRKTKNLYGISGKEEHLALKGINK